MTTIEEIKSLLEQAQTKLALLQQLEQALSQCAELEQKLGLAVQSEAPAPQPEATTQTEALPEKKVISIKLTPAPSNTQSLSVEQLHNQVIDDILKNDWNCL